MQDGRVCVAGYDQEGACVRPVLPPPGIQERSLYWGGCPIIFPFAVVEYDLIKQVPSPPHTEDALFDPDSVHLCGVLQPLERKSFLCRTLFPMVAAIFEEPIHKDVGHYLLDGRGPRSLGTVRVEQLLNVAVQDEKSGALKPRISFIDGRGAEYRLAVTDLAWRYYAEQMHNGGQLTLDAVAEQLTSMMVGSEIFLRIGLARGWSQHPDRCYLQITGIYTFPDYLCGRIFADFAPPFPEDDW
jgi:hypothetical protein